MSAIDVHASARRAAREQELAAAVQDNRLDSKCLYLTPRQAELWQEVSRRHSPVHHDPEFRRIYDVAFARVAGEVRGAKPVNLTGLGCGTGEKEAQLCRALRTSHEVHFYGIDVSEALVQATQARLLAAGAIYRRGLVCDLAQEAYLREWLQTHVDPGPRLFTFFGLVPNFSPSSLTRLLETLLRPGDRLLASVHLVPVENGEPELEAMRRPLPQYDNAETLAWLAEALHVMGLDSHLEAPEIVVGQVEDVSAFLGRANWHSAGSKGPSTPGSGPLSIFQSFRYTPESFSALLRRSGLASECLALTACNQEGIWSICHGGSSHIAMEGPTCPANCGEVA